MPFRLFNGVVVESSPTAGIAESIAEVEERGVPCGVQLREGRHPEVEEEAARLGLTDRLPMPGMTTSPDELVDSRVPEFEIVAVKDDSGLETAARVAAGDGGSLDAFRALYAPGMLVAGMSVYLGVVDGEPVTTAIGYQTGREVAIFSVITPRDYRRRGYGAAITAHATRAAFDNGADLAWLQTSEMGESVYRRLGFRHVVMHLMLRRPRPS